MNVYEVSTEMPDTANDRTYSRFTVSAKTFEEAVIKAKKSGNILPRTGERIAEVVLLARGEYE